MKKVPVQKKHDFSISVEFSGQDLVTLEKIGSSLNTKSVENFLAHLAHIVANIKGARDQADSEKNRNKTIDVVRRAVDDLKQARAWLYHNEYPLQLIDDLTYWSDSLRPSVAKRIMGDSRIELVPPEKMAVGAVALMLSGYGVDVRAYPHQKQDINPFLSVSEILFRAAGINKTLEAIGDAHCKFEERWGSIKLLEDARFMTFPTYQDYYTSIENAYSAGDSFTAKYTYRPNTT